METSDIQNRYTDSFASAISGSPEQDGLREHVTEPLQRHEEDYPEDGEVETFLRFALTDLSEDWLLLSFLPLPADLLAEAPARILAPPAESNYLDHVKVERLAAQPPCILAVCTFESEEEKASARTILSQLTSIDQISIFAAQLIPPGDISPTDHQATAEMANKIMDRHNEILDMGVHDVLMSPRMTPGLLQMSVYTMNMTRARHMNLMESVLRDNQLTVSAQDLPTLQERERSLLWDVSVKELMPQFPRIDENIHADDTGVAGYTFVGRHACVAGTVMLAKTWDIKPVAVKIISKKDIHNPIEVENVYREYQFLTKGLDHPNIVRVVDILHTKSDVYLVMQDVGSSNLEQLCKHLPGSRLDEEHALDAFGQITDALGWMHMKMIVHRNVSLHHVAVRQEGRDSLHCTLLDFHFATISQENIESDVDCGSLPCMAPEMVLRDTYVPRFADCWSVGILLLEVAGGLTSLFMAANISREEEHSLEGVQAVARFFRSTPDCHRRALSLMGGVCSPEILSHLKQLLILEPQLRMPLTDLATSLKLDRQQA